MEWRCLKCGMPAVATRRVYVLASTWNQLPASWTDEVAHADGSICIAADAAEIAPDSQPEAP